MNLPPPLFTHRSCFYGNPATVFSPPHPHGPLNDPPELHYGHILRISTDSTLQTHPSHQHRISQPSKEHETWLQRSLDTRYMLS